MDETEERGAMIDTLLVDTHAHLADEAFESDRDKVLQRARSAGVAAVISVSESIEDAEKNLELSVAEDMILPAAGLYPSILDFLKADEMLSLIRRERESLRAMGEIGLDYWIVKEEREREIQREIFQSFIDLSIELELPLNVHSRSAGRHVIDLLLRHNAKKVQLHAFDGKASYALRAVEAGYYFSIPPSVIRSTQKQKLVRRLPLQSLLVETDSPVLGPSSGKRNEPVNVLLSVQAIAGLKGIGEEEVLQAVSRNFQNLYGVVG
jgi:TatD DNase family protein